MPRFVLRILVVVGVAAVAACAPTTGATTGGSDLRRLGDDCRARGGVLVPTGAMSGEVARDNACEIRGAAPRT